MISYYGGAEKFNPDLVAEIWRSYERFQVDRFQALISRVIKNCKFPPLVADFSRAEAELKAEEKIFRSFGPTPEEESMMSYEPTFPTDEWFADNMAQARHGLKDNTDPAIASHMMQMRRLRNIMIINYRDWCYRNPGKR